ncbi:IS3 family transposase [Lysinibacillus sp. NPDC056959]|uniref:IS3 family transposase n=1 Tax=Lysinibacillus sp. NPDC056959 TaxID=3345981 RepID=UPI003626EEC2
MFFGNFKDETNIKSYETQHVVKAIRNYMSYYNHYRGQRNIKKMTSTRYSITFF